MLTIGTDPKVPYTDGALSTPLIFAGAEVLAEQSVPTPSIAAEFITRREWTDAPPTAPPVVRGQRIVFSDLPGIERRAFAVTRDLVDPDRVDLVLGVPTTSLRRQVAALLANTPGVRR
jgi:hypothetical protein